ncbi:hypothetical protein BJY04DRAFT_221255 [Aspergillus karnatakaensis]|uniref:uncharacterized protein n=1 Tax=Aspergillus karnatakaensis TaxID=1810916 RepID=UPI003CCD230E
MPPYKALGATFLIARIVQSCSLIAIIGLVANFIAEIVKYDAKPPGIFIGTITVTSLASLYTIITTILFIDNILPFLPSLALDFLLLIAVIVVSVILGKPLSYLECTEIGNILNADDPSSAHTFATHLRAYLGSLSGEVEYKTWIGTSRDTCYEAKSVWGLGIGMCIMFFFTAVCCGFMWRQSKGGNGGDVEGGKEVE